MIKLLYSVEIIRLEYCSKNRLKQLAKNNGLSD